MPDYIGLYYPHIAFSNDGWVKLAALYWDKLGRIIPPDYQLHDSDTVQRLDGELGFIENFNPDGRDTYEVGELFSQMLRQYGDLLVRQYSILSQDVELEYVYSGAKMANQLTGSLLDAGLAVRKREGGRSIGMHPKLAFVYMEALAEQMALTRRLRPVTDDELAFVAFGGSAGGYTLERLTQALLGTGDSNSRVLEESQSQDIAVKQMVTIAFQSVLPEGIGNVPIEKIIKLRQQHRTELTAFQTFIHDFVKMLDTIQQVDDPHALSVHLNTAYEREIKPLLDDLTKCMKSLAIETVPGVLNVKVALPPLLNNIATAFHLSFPPEAIAPAAIAWGVLPVLQKKRTEIREKVQKSPVAYLLYAQEGLTTTKTVSQVVRAARQMLFGV